MSDFTRRHKKELRALIDAFRALHDFPKDFEFTSLQLGRNTDVFLHSDKDSIGPSVVLAWAPFEGGRFLVAGESHVVNGNCFCFDGREQHLVEDYQPRDRRSLVAFSHPAAADLEKDDREVLVQCGFPRPSRNLKRTGFTEKVVTEAKPRLVPAVQVRRTLAHDNDPRGSGEVQSRKRLCLKSTNDLLGVRLQDFVVSSAEALQDRLVSARRCTYRGESQLPLLPWKAEFRGAVLIIDLFAGISGALVAASTLDIDMFAIVVENDLGLLESQRVCFPDAIFVSDIQLIGGASFAKFLVKQSFSDVLIIGGPPC